MGQSSGHCRLCGGLDKARHVHVFPTALSQSANIEKASLHACRGAKYKTNCLLDDLDEVLGSIQSTKIISNNIQFTFHEC